MKIIILLLLVCEVVFIHSRTIKNKISNCKRIDHSTIPGYTICHLENKQTVIERNNYTNNLTIFNNEIDSVPSEIFSKFPSKSALFRIADEKSYYNRRVMLSNEFKKINTHEICLKNPETSQIDINDLLSQIIIRSLETDSPIFNMTVLKTNIAKKSEYNNWLNGVCKLLLPIQFVTIEDNDTTKIEPNAVESYKDIKYLAMTLYKIDNLPSNILSSFNQLLELSFECPKITSLPKEIFSSLKSLTYLEIKMSLIKLEMGIFDGLLALTEINLSGNQLKSIPENIFKDLHNLNELNLGHNQLTTLEPTIFGNLNKLKVLKIENNLLTSIKADTLRNLHSLNTLSLSNNNISIIEDNSLPTESISIINLNSNLLTSDSIGNIFNGMDNLEILDLSANKISKISKNMFNGLINLQVLDLGDNIITEIENDAWAGLDNVNLTISYDNLIETTTTPIETTTLDYTPTDTSKTIDTTTFKSNIK